MTTILFPSNPIQPKSVDESFGWEAQAAKEAGFGIGRIDLEVILGGDIKIANVPEDGEVVYRGWLMPTNQYRAIHERLGGRLIPTPEQYEISYELPRWYVLVEGVTPRTLFLPASEWGDFSAKLGDVAECVEHTFSTRLSEADQKRLREISEWHRAECEKGHFFALHMPTDLLELPGPRPVIVKDYVKSAKHQWFDACYMPDARDREEVMRVTKNFLDIQSNGLVGGLCFRQFEHFKPIGTHPKTNLPLVNEWRAFMRKGKVFYVAPYWRDGDYSGSKPTPAEIDSLAVGLKDLDLIAVDVAEYKFVADGGPRWAIIEINPGGAAGVPEGGDVKDFYRALREEYPG